LNLRKAFGQDEQDEDPADHWDATNILPGYPVILSNLFELPDLGSRTRGTEPAGHLGKDKPTA
jgi:hypothetical protein